MKNKIIGKRCSFCRIKRRSKKIMNYEYEDIFDECDTEIVEVLEIKEYEKYD